MTDGRWSVDFDRCPFLVIWETTRACALACRHCRASAIPGPVAGELDIREGMDLIDAVVEMGTPLLVLSGGDPLSRPDLPELVRHAKRSGLRVATIPAATPRLTQDRVRELRDAGLDQIAFSLDFPTEEQHDAFRGVPGSFRLTLQAAGWARDVGLPVQINTCVWGESAESLPETADRVESLGAVFWEVFFLVPVGRGADLAGLTPKGCEELFTLLHSVQERQAFILKVTEAPHYRRYLQQHRTREHGRVSGLHHPTSEQRTSVPLAQRGVNAGNGFLFVSHLGEVYPSGFLPVTAGSVRRDSLSNLYRTSDLFTSLRDPARLKGACGACPYSRICGGSRSRAYALTGDWLESDPWCGFIPAHGRAEPPRSRTF
jgi:radical SAM protein